MIIYRSKKIVTLFILSILTGIGCKSPDKISIDSIISFNTRVRFQNIGWKDNAGSDSYLYENEMEIDSIKLYLPSNWISKSMFGNLKNRRS
jgi:hypothetical protein